jgi:lysophospholipase L1-like esterase
VFELVREKVEAGVPISWFIDQNDHIHPNRYAYEFIAEQIAASIRRLDLIQ